MIWLLLACTGGSDDPAVPPQRYSHVGSLNAAGSHLYISGGSSSDGKRIDAWRFDLAAGEWEQLGDPPEPIFRSTLAADGDQAWVFAGSSTDNIESDRLYLWDLAADTWTQKSSGPPGRYKAAAAWVDGVMVVQGGRYDDDGDTLTYDDLWTYDPATDAWAELQIADGPGPITRQALAWDDTRRALWLSGGIDDASDRHAWLWKLDWDSLAWTQVASDDDGFHVQASHSLALHEDVLYSWAGAGEESDVWAYDIEAGSWSTFTSGGPAARDAQVTAQDGSTVYIMGGDPADDDSLPSFVNDVWSLDLSSGSWTELAPIQ